MSELIQKHDNRTTIRWKLLTGASALALSAYVSYPGLAYAEDADHSQVWIEFGGQLSRLQDGQEIYAPPFVALTPPDFSPPQKAERPPLYGLDASAKISFQPDNSDWTLSASILYGRANSGGRHVHHQSVPTSSYAGYRKIDLYYYSGSRHVTQILRPYPIAARFTDVVTKQQENHLILDFQAGKDVGLGLFGNDATSSLSAGVRIAQFTSKSRAALKEDPDWAFKAAFYTFSQTFYSVYRTVAVTKLVIQPYHMFSGNFQADRSFSGLGPSISWKASLPFAGNTQDGALSFDWGLNAALLFGRQKAKIHRQTMALYHEAAVSGYFFHGTDPSTRIPVYDHHSTPERSRNVTVPNVGGFAGISWQSGGAKVSFGYKVDWFFGAIDGGIDAAKKEDRGFHGPYASISIGLGD